MKDSTPTITVSFTASCYEEAVKIIEIVKSAFPARTPAVVSASDLLPPGPFQQEVRPRNKFKHSVRRCLYAGCGKEFTPNSGRQKYCSAACRKLDQSIPVTKQQVQQSMRELNESNRRLDHALDKCQETIGQIQQNPYKVIDDINAHSRRQTTKTQTAS